jgi:hypothetical protein
MNNNKNAPKAPKTLQRFTFCNMLRSQVNPAAYNPRTIDGSAAKKLEKVLRRHGLVEPIVVNIRGDRNIVVGGHQRLKIMDERIMAGADYTIPVAAIDVDEVEEKSINLMLNNVDAQGSFDFDKLASLLGEISASGESDITAATGFDKAGLELLFDGGVIESVFGDGSQSQVFAEQSAAESETIADMAAIAAAGNGAASGVKNDPNPNSTNAAESNENIVNAKTNSTKSAKTDPNSREALVARRTDYFTDDLKSAAESEFMFVVVGESNRQISQFLAVLHLPPANRYVKLANLAEAMGIDVGADGNGDSDDSGDESGGDESGDNTNVPTTEDQDAIDGNGVNNADDI